MANLEDIIFNELETEDIKDVNIVEGVFMLNPALAFLTLKRNTLKKLKNIEDATTGKAKKKAKEMKGKALAGREKIKHDLQLDGKSDDSTSFKLTKEQKNTLSEINEKYGKELTDDILKFRKEILAPYQVIKRNVKNNKMLTSKETFGMTKEQFKSALESGRRKIEARGSRFEKFDNFKDRAERQEKALNDLKEIKKNIDSNRTIPPSILDRILQEYDLGKKEFKDYSMNDLKKAYFEIIKNVDAVTDLDADDDIDDFEKTKQINKLIQRNIDLRKGRIAKQDMAKRMEVKAAEQGYTDSDRNDYNESVLYESDLTKNKNFRLSNGGFNSALGLYFLRRNIMNQLKPEKKNSIYKQTYRRIVDELIQQAEDSKKKTLAKTVKNKTKTEFNDLERKIWELRPSVKTQSGNLEDYVQKLKEEDFFNPKYFKKSDKLIKAEKDIEAGIKRFERSLKKKISKEDYAKLKKYRLINNLITVGELKSPDKLFKSPEEINKEAKDKNTSFVPDDEFERKIREIATTEYDSISDLNKAKEEAEELFKQKREQGDDDIADSMEGILAQIRRRKKIKSNKVRGNEIEMTDSDLIDAGVIEKAIKRMLSKDYKNNDDEFKKDQIRINKMVDKYKEEGGEEAKRNMDEIDFLFKKLRTKTNTMNFRDE
jgi:hypothetical protein